MSGRRSRIVFACVWSTLLSLVVSACNHSAPLPADAGQSESALAVKRGVDFSAKGEFVRAIEEWRSPANQGNARAQRDLGLAYELGQGVPQDYAQAIAWYRKAANQGNAEGQVNLGYMYYQGLGVAKDEAQAVNWYRKAADQGNADAENGLGAMYDNGEGVEKDAAQAVAWFRRAAEQGDPEAEMNLGNMYEDGRGVAKDEVQAVAWYRKAAEQGDAVAQYNLGVRYWSGHGVAKDDVQAIAWYRKAADQGYASAQLNLGDSYRDGQGVPQNDAQAAAWYRKAADQGDVDGQTALNNLINPEPVAPAPVDVVMFDIGNGLRFLRGESLDDFKALHPTFVCEADASPPDCTPAAEKPAVADCPSSDPCTAIEYTFDKEKKMDGFSVTYAKSSTYKKLLAVSTKQFGRPTHHSEQLYGAPAISERWVFKRSADVMVRFIHLSGNYGSYGFNQPIEEAYSINYTSDGFQDD
jgi:TPR repeat protein